MKTRLYNIAVAVLIAVMTIMSLGASADTLRIELKNGAVYTYDTADLDEVKYVGGEYGSATGIGVKIYPAGANYSIDFLYSEMASFEIQSVATPEITPGSRIISSATAVTITCVTEGATIYYTLDGTTPTTASLSGASPVTFVVSETTTVRAIAVKGSLVSEVAEAVYTFSEDNNQNRNTAIAGWENMCSSSGAHWEPWRLEFPHMRTGGSNSWVVKETANYGNTYSLEWDNSLVANRWSCYQMHAGNMLKNVERTKKFYEDPDLPEETRSTEDDYTGSGYSKGHLCPSADRLCSEDQNKQTFFLSNMQPQIQYHNGGQWSQLEEDIRKWAARCDTLYVVKAATISEKVTLNNQQVDGRFSTLCNDRLIVPKYFYMAVMAYDKANDSYKAMGIWTYHCSSADDKQSAEYITIDELEKRTGIDFYCNLPDNLEQTVESTAVDEVFWFTDVTKK